VDNDEKDERKWSISQLQYNVNIINFADADAGDIGIGIHPFPLMLKRAMCR
jgi:hypothetical protein